MILCPYCQKQAVFKTSLDFYGIDYGTNVWICKPCDARVGTRVGSKSPLGTLADKELRGLRIECRERFEVLWKGKKLTQRQSYMWLSVSLRIPLDEAHIGKFRKGVCLRLLDILDKEGIY